ncbi:terpene synthase family protein [Streptomyces natalensis]|nr:terpene synthase family protein [Streptomyces natalensis]
MADRDLSPMCAADTFMTATAVVSQLKDWAATLRDNGARDVTLTAAFGAAVAAPWLPVEAIQLGVRAGVWLTAFDDRIDTEAYDAGSAGRAFDRYRRTALGAEPDAADPLNTALAQLAVDIERQQWGAVVGPLWRSTVANTLIAMAADRAYATAVRDGGSPPGIEEYLRIGARSSGLDFTVVPLWAAMPDADMPCFLPVLTRAMPHACMALRLANDVAGQDRERAEGVVNAVSLGMSPPQALASITHHTQQFQSALTPLVAAGNRSAIATVRLLQWALRAYTTASPSTAPEGLA